MRYHIIMSMIKKNHLYSLFAICFLLASIFFHWVGYIIIIYSLSVTISRYFRVSLISGIFFAILTLCSIISIASFLFDAMLPLSPQFTLLYYLLLVTVASCILFQPKKLIKTARHIIDTPTIVALVVAAITAIIILVPVVRLDSSSSIIQFLTSGEDNASHFAMLQYNISRQSPPYFDAEPTGLISSLNIYPQGVQSFFAFTYWAITGGFNQSLATMLILYSLVMAILAASLSFICSLVIYRVLDNKNVGWVFTTILSSFIFMGATIFLVIWGFTTQIAALTLLLALLYLTLSVPMPLKRSGLHIPLMILGALVIGITFSWYLLTPIACVLLLPLLLRSFSMSRAKTIAYTLTVGLLSALPVLLNFFTGKGSGAINEPGGVYKYEAVGMGVVLFSLACSILIIVKAPNKYHAATIKWFLASSLLLSAIIGIYQLISTGELHYYFYKSLYLLFIIGIFALAFVIHILLRRLRLSCLSLNILSLSLLVAFLVILIFVVRPVYPRVYINNWFNHLVKSDSLSQAIQIRSRNPNMNQDVFYISQCDRVQEYLINRWTGAILLSENKTRGEIMHKRLNNDPSNTKHIQGLIDSQQTIIIKYDEGVCAK